MSKKEQSAVSIAVEKGFARMQRGCRRRRILIIAFLGVLFLLLLLLSFFLYVNYWPGNLDSGYSFRFNLNEIFLKSELSRLEPIQENYDYEMAYKNGDNKALLKMYGTVNGTPIRERFPKKVEDKYVFYYDFDDIGAEVFYEFWMSSCKRDMIKYGLSIFKKPDNSDGNVYAFYYGEEAAKGKPNYQFSTLLMFTKDGNSHFLHVFCNSQDFLPELITRFVDEINALNDPPSEANPVQ